MIQTHK